MDASLAKTFDRFVTPLGSVQKRCIIAGIHVPDVPEMGIGNT
jgi:hypothetical protein